MATPKYKVLFVGYGHLAKALLSKQFLKSSTVHAINSKKQIFHINMNKKLKSLNQSYDYIFLLVKPNTFKEIGDTFKDYMNKNSIIISCMAGVLIETLSNKLNTNKIVRIMPNVMAKSNKSQTYLFSKNKSLINTNLKKLLSPLGILIVASKEDQMNLATSVYGSGPAFVAFLINAYITAAKEISKTNQIKETHVLDLIKSVLEVNHSSRDLTNFISSIASKKGTTQAGVKYLESQKIKKTLYTTLLRAYKRARELSIEAK